MKIYVLSNNIYETKKPTQFHTWNLTILSRPAKLMAKIIKDFEVKRIQIKIFEIST